jgi:hypothetical protein
MGVNSMLASLAFAAAVSATPLLDRSDLRHSMEAARSAPAAAPRAGEKFRVSLPFVDGEKRNMRTFQSPARWTYDFKHQTLELTIGLGEISQANYDRFAPQGLDKLPPLQTFVFDTAERTQRTIFKDDHRYTDAGERVKGKDTGWIGYTMISGNASTVSSYGLAAPFVEGGPSALPAGFRPLTIHRMKMQPKEVRSMVETLSLIVEGETTDLGQTPSVFCGAWSGLLQASQVNDKLNIAVKADQCFVTAKINRVLVIGRDGVLASWPR